MRIAHVTATFPPYLGGTGNVCLHNARELVRRGHDVHVFTAATADVPAGAVGSEFLGGARVHRLRPLLRVGNAPVLPGLVRALGGFDLIHLHYPFISGAELVRLASLLHRTPLVVTFHNDLIGDGARAPVFALYQRLSATLAVRGASRLCAVSLDHYESSRLRRALRPRPGFAVEVPNGVDTECFSRLGPRADLRGRYGVPPSARVVLFVAALDRAHHFKGLGRLLRALGSLPPDVWLLIVGDGDQRSEHEREARDLGLAARTVFTGAIDHEATPRFYRRADLTVLPSSPPESFGLVLIESLACGTPVIANDIPGVRTLVEHGADGLLVDADDPPALAGAIRQLLDDEALRQSMGRRGRAKVERRYAWEQIGARLEAIYGQLLDHPQPTRHALGYGER